MFLLIVGIFGETAAQREIQGVLDRSYIAWGDSETKVCHLRSNLCAPVEKTGLFIIDIDTNEDTVDLDVHNINYGVVPIKVAVSEKTQFIPSSDYVGYAYIRRPYWMIVNSAYLASTEGQTIEPAREDLEFHWGFDGSIGVDISSYQMKGFERVLNQGAQSILSDSSYALFQGDLNLRYKRIEMAFGWGTGSSDNDESDVYEYSVNQNLYNFRFGYRFIDRRHFALTPYTGIRWYRWRLLQRNKTVEELPDYLNDPDLDLRITQFTAEFGMRAGVIIRGIPSWPNNALQVGLYAGYLLTLHQNPIINSSSSKLDNDIKIDFDQPYFGIYFSLVVP